MDILNRKPIRRGVMIRVIMLGRLGNNLFQYAYGRMLAEKHGVPLLLNASWFNHRTWPYVEPLRHFPGVKSGKAEVDRPWSLPARALLKLTGKHYLEYSGKTVVRERKDDQSFDAGLLGAPADCVVFGYFQTPLYFRDIEPLLRLELATDRMGLETGQEALANQLRAPNSVAVHVRRTDYINNPNLILLDLNYYQRAMSQMRDRLPNPKFHVFSDDPGWCLKNLGGDDVSVCTHSDPFHPLQDLHLMQLAGNHIIANSSYSWWAAWLGKKPGQQVVMPDAWFKGGIHAPASEKNPGSWSMIPGSTCPT